MADVQSYVSIDSKRRFFSNGHSDSFVINTKKQLDKWFQDVENKDQDKSKQSATALIYRGLQEAKYKLFTSGQRIWIADEMKQWARKSYLSFINDIVQEANMDDLIRTVFDLYNYLPEERDFPILSLLQHYGAPTALIDWTYDQNVAFYFATERITRPSSSSRNEIDEYFSIVRIDKEERKAEDENSIVGALVNVIDYSSTSKKDSLFNMIMKDQQKRNKEKLTFRNKVEFPDGKFPTISTLERAVNVLYTRIAYYVTDFEERGISIGLSKGHSKLIIRRNKPITSVFNQNIIPQKGLFIFNPYEDMPLEELLSSNSNNALNQTNSIECFNIHKDLAEYLRTKIAVRHGITNSYLFPALTEEVAKIKKKTINALI